MVFLLVCAWVCTGLTIFNGEYLQTHIAGVSHAWDRGTCLRKIATITCRSIDCSFIIPWTEMRQKDYTPNTRLQSEGRDNTSRGRCQTWRSRLLLQIWDHVSQPQRTSTGISGRRDCKWSPKLVKSNFRGWVREDMFKESKNKLSEIPIWLTPEVEPKDPPHHAAPALFVEGEQDVCRIQKKTKNPPFPLPRASQRKGVKLKPPLGMVILCSKSMQSNVRRQEQI